MEENFFDNAPSMKIEDMQKDSQVIGEYLNRKSLDYFSFNLIDEEDNAQKRNIPPIVWAILYCLCCVLSLLCFFSLYDTCKIFIIYTAMYTAQLILFVDLYETYTR